MTDRQSRAYILPKEGLNQAGRSDAREALAAYEHAIRLKPNYAEAYNNRGNVKFQSRSI